MISQRTVEILVGLFLVMAAIALSVLAFKVSGLTSLFPSPSYTISAEFDDIGGLKVRSPVKIGGVQVGQVINISLDPVTFKAVVKMEINQEYNDIPDDSSASILTSGLLGDNYVSLVPMYNKTMLQNGSAVKFTHSAMILEKLIGQFIYKLGDSHDKAGSAASNKST